MGLNLQNPKQSVFHQRIDFYWQYIAVYSLILIVYGMLRGTIRKDTVSVVLSDPIIILLAAFILGSAISMLVIVYRRKTIIIGQDFITFKNRFRERKHSIKEISSITIGKEKLIKVRRGAFKVIKIMLYNRSKPIRIRPSSFNNEKSLVEEMTRLKRTLNK